MEEEEESFISKELHAKKDLRCPFYGVEMEESISMWTLDFFPLILPAFFNSSSHQMILRIIDVEEKEDSFSFKEFECQLDWFSFNVYVEFMEESLLAWTLHIPH